MGYNDQEIWNDENLQDRRLDVEWLYLEAAGDLSVSPAMLASYRDELMAIDDELQRRATA